MCNLWIVIQQLSCGLCSSIWALKKPFIANCLQHFRITENNNNLTSSTFNTTAVWEILKCNPHDAVPPFLAQIMHCMIQKELEGDNINNPFFMAVHHFGCQNVECILHAEPLMQWKKPSFVWAFPWTICTDTDWWCTAAGVAMVKIDGIFLLLCCATGTVST